MILHFHRYKYLSKEITQLTKHTFYHGGMLGVSSSEDIKETITYVRSVCTKCGNIKSQTVPGNLTLDEIVEAGFIEGIENNK